MNRHFSQYGIEFFQLQSFGSVFTVFGRDVPRSTWKSACFVLGAFHNHLNSVTFLSHRSIYFLLQVNCYLIIMLPLFCAFFNTALIPTLLIVRNALVQTFKVIQASSSGMKKLFLCRFG